MRKAIVIISEAGQSTAQAICREWPCETVSRNEVAQLWSQYDCWVFVGAMGICVRTIAPLIKDKHTDPAVVCADTQGRHVIAVLSGHVGGANEAARQIAAAIGALPVITTQSDTMGVWPLDLLPGRFGWECTDPLNPAIFAFVNSRPTALLLDIRDRGTDYLESTLPAHVTVVKSVDDITPEKYQLAIIVSYRRYPDIKGVTMLRWVPRVLTLGVGLAHQAAPAEKIIAGIDRVISENGIYPEAIRQYATIDIKGDEPVIRLLQQQGQSVCFFTAEQLAEVSVTSPSATVMSHVGTPSVCEASALLASDHGTLLLEKHKDESRQFTLAVAIDRTFLRQGHIEIVGAGPGDPDLVSVRGRKMLEKADLILYAGSLVPRELTLCAREGATVRSSAGMTLEEQCDLMKDFYDRGKLIVRLHTGDPCIFGAIQEQMAFFDKHQMTYHITPGISSFLAAAAELKSQFTIPERTQTIILTRGEGRTPMPEREKLHLLARSQSTMCIFLSAAIADEVQKELLTEYPPETPVAVCYHLTWKDQRIYRGTLGQLAQIIHDHHLTLTTMIVVGEAIGNRKGLSELYSAHFSHLYRKAKS